MKLCPSRPCRPRMKPSAMLSCTFLRLTPTETTENDINFMGLKAKPPQCCTSVQADAIEITKDSSPLWS